MTETERKRYQAFLATLSEKERELYKTGLNFYAVQLKNVGGLVMPVIFAVEYTDGSKEELRIPAEIWRKNNIQTAKLLVTPKEIKSITLDPHQETADADMENNFYPRRPVKSRFQLFKEQSAPNPMQLDRQEKGKAVNPTTGQQ